MKKAIFVGLILIALLLSGCITQDTRSSEKDFELVSVNAPLPGST